jgi:hypothetical protein
MKEVRLMRVRWMVVGALVAALGCGSRQFVPVSGKVTLNGKPLANALVSFNRIPAEGSIESGPSAVGTTNQNGEYTLRVSLKQAGALVGKHSVAITAMSSQVSPDSDAPVPPGGGPRNIVPARYNEKTELAFEVPAAGTDKANFDLKSP